MVAPALFRAKAVLPGGPAVTRLRNPAALALSIIPAHVLDTLSTSVTTPPPLTAPAVANVRP